MATSELKPTTTGDDVIHYEMLQNLNFENAKLVDSHLLPPSRVSNYDGHPVETVEAKHLKLVHKGVNYSKYFVVARDDLQPIVGLQTIQRLGLVHKVHRLSSDPELSALLVEFADVFEGIGAMPTEVSLKLKPEASLTVCAPRKIPLALRERVSKAKLSEMES